MPQQGRQQRQLGLVAAAAHFAPNRSQAQTMLVCCTAQRLISSAANQMVMVWSMVTWACVQTVQPEVYEAGPIRCIISLAVGGSTLVADGEGVVNGYVGVRADSAA